MNRAKPNCCKAPFIVQDYSLEIYNCLVCKKKYKINIEKICPICFKSQKIWKKISGHYECEETNKLFTESQMIKQQVIENLLTST
jgi:hypothetical protein